MMYVLVLDEKLGREEGNLRGFFESVDRYQYTPVSFASDVGDLRHHALFVLRKKLLHDELRLVMCDF
jgi:hypothetical protein